MTSQDEQDRQVIHTEGGAYVAGNVDTGGGDFIGRDKITNFFQTIVIHPSVWPDALWGLLVRHWGFLVAALAMLAALTAVYWRYRDLYLIPTWRWSLAAFSLLAAAWAWYIWFSKRQRPQAALGSVAGFAFVLLIAWQSWQIAYPHQIEREAFGIAVAEFGEGADFIRTPRAREISGQIYEHLQNNLVMYGVDEQGRPQQGAALKRIGVIPDSDTARRIGEAINADVVIWGQLLTTGEGKTTIRFQVIEIPDRAVNPSFPLVLPVNTASTDIFSEEIDVNSDPILLKEVVAEQAAIITSFTNGLIMYLNQDYRQSLFHLESAADALEKADRLDVSPKGRSLIMFFLSKANQSLGRVEVGQEWLRQAEALNPDEPAIPISLALGYRSLGDVKTSDQALARGLDLTNHWLEEHPDDTTARYNRGVIYQIRNQYREAAFDFEAVIKKDPDYYVAYISLGQSYGQVDQFDQADAAYQRAIELAGEKNINPSWAYLNLGLLYQKYGRSEQARPAFKQAIEHAPDFAWIRVYYARFLESQGEMDAALAVYQKAAEISENKGWGYSTLAGFQKRQGMYTDALENFRLAVHEQPDDPLLYVQLAETYQALGELDQAADTFELAIQHGPDSYYAHTQYAALLYQRGEFKQAAEMYEIARGLKPGDGAILLNLGSAYERLEEYDLAREIYRQIINDETGFSTQIRDTARQRLENLPDSE